MCRKQKEVNLSNTCIKTEKRKVEGETLPTYEQSTSRFCKKSYENPYLIWSICNRSLNSDTVIAFQRAESDHGLICEFAQVIQSFDEKKYIYITVARKFRKENIIQSSAE